mgnify:CR=1 FL=1
MKVINPTPVTDTMFSTSTVTEADYAAWAVGTAYTATQRVILGTADIIGVGAGTTSLFTGGQWTLTNLTFVNATNVAPDGTSTAVVVTDAAGSSAKSADWLANKLSFITGVCYCFSVYLKAITKSTFQIVLGGVALPATATVYFDLTTPQSYQGVPLAPTSCVAVGDGWFRCSTFFKATATGTLDVRIAPTLTYLGAITYTGLGTNCFYAWHAEAFAVPANALTALAEVTTQTHKIYECLVGNTGAHPLLNLTGITPNWLEYGSTNRWKMFDGEIGTSTSGTTPLTVKLKPGPITSVALLELVGTSVTVSMKDQAAGTTVYNQTITLDGTLIVDWYSYFFEPYRQLTEVVLTDLPSYGKPELTMTVTGTASTTVSCGVAIVGNAYSLGETEYGASFGIIDYSVKSTNAFGVTTIVKRKYSKRMDARLALLNTDLNRVQQLLASLRSTPVLWVGTDIATYSPLNVYGFYKDFTVEVAYYTTSYCSLQIEGIT